MNKLKILSIATFTLLISNIALARTIIQCPPPGSYTIPGYTPVSNGQIPLGSYFVKASIPGKDATPSSYGTYITCYYHVIIFSEDLGFMFTNYSNSAYKGVTGTWTPGNKGFYECKGKNRRDCQFEYDGSVNK